MECKAGCKLEGLTVENLEEVRPLMEKSNEPYLFRKAEFSLTVSGSNQSYKSSCGRMS